MVSWYFWGDVKSLGILESSDSESHQQKSYVSDPPVVAEFSRYDLIKQKPRVLELGFPQGKRFKP